MKCTLAIAALALFACSGFAQSKNYHYHATKTYQAPKANTPHYSTVPVRGYMKSNGTYVMPHYQTAPNATKLDNWSSKPNVNPYTGKAGTKDPYKTKCCGA